MFKGFAARFGISTTPADHPELRAALKVLREIDRETHDWAVDYILNGEHPERLAVWPAADDSHPYYLLGSPGSTPYLYSHISDARAAINARIDKAVPGWTLAKALDARGVLYQSITTLSPEQIVRLGRFLVTINRARTFEPSSTLVPDWLAHLTLDALYTTMGARDRTKPPAPRDLFSPQLILALLSSEGIEGPAAIRQTLSLMFDRRGIELSGYPGEPLQSFYRQRDLPAFAAANVAVLAELVPKFSLSGRLGLVTFAISEPVSRELLPLVASLATDTSKAVRAHVLVSLTTLDGETQATLLEPVLRTAAPSRTADLVNYLARIDGDAGRAILERVLAASAGSKVAELIEVALGRGDVFAERADAPPTPRPDFERVLEKPVPDDFAATARAGLDAKLASLRDDLKNVETTASADWTKRRIAWISGAIQIFRAVSDADVRNVASFLAGGTPKRPAQTEQVAQVIGDDYQLTLLQTFRLFVLPDKTVHWYQLEKRHSIDIDFRTLEDGLVKFGHIRPAHEVARLAYNTWKFDIASVDPALIWPFFEDHPESIEEAFGMRPPSGASSYSDQFVTARALELVELFPSIPRPMLARITEMALGEGKTNRLESQTVIERHADAVTLASQGLTSAKLEIRTTAAKWLERLRDAAAIPALRTALAKEKRETVKSAMLSALEVLGDDVSDYLSPAALTADAERNASIALPAGLDWFPFDRLPACRWAQNGEPVAPSVLRWWIVLAAKLKEPGANGLLGRYVSLLDEKSRAELGEFVMRSWIAEDTTHPSDEESRDHATRGAPASLASHLDSAKRYPNYYGEYANYTLDAAFEELRREYAGRYLRTAVASKGVLALTAGIPGHRVVQLAQSFMRDHYLRRYQIESLIAAVAANDDPAAMQLLLSVARRHRTGSVQARARELVAELAERRGWTAEELADRTIPTANFGDDGLLRLSFGEREFTARLSPTFTLELSNDTGKVIKSLPAPRETEDAETVKEAKSALTASRAELKQIVSIQSQRLYEAMCVERSWPVAEWKEFLLGHPIVSRLFASLVWIETSADGSQRLFRAADGALIDVADDDVELATDSTISLAHSALVSGADAAAWRAHLTDYELTPLFDQFSGQAPVVPEGATEIADRKGWLSDSFTIRGNATKLGYQRGSSEDGGWFMEYTKDFTSVNLQVVISFTGNVLPEENIPAAITTLTTRSLRRGGGKDVPLATVPSVLLAAAYGDYRRIADAGSFDAEWEKKAAW